MKLSILGMFAILLMYCNQELVSDDCLVYSNFVGKWVLLRSHNNEFTYTLKRNESYSKMSTYKLDFDFKFPGRPFSVGIETSVTESYSLFIEESYELKCPNGGGLYQFIFQGVQTSKKDPDSESESLAPETIELSTTSTLCVNASQGPRCPPNECVDQECQICIYEINRTLTESCRLCSSCGGLYTESGGKINNDFMIWKNQGEQCNSTNLIESNSFELCCRPKSREQAPYCKLCISCGGTYPYQSGSRTKMIQNRDQFPEYQIFGFNCVGDAPPNYQGAFTFCCVSTNDCNFCTSCATQSAVISRVQYDLENLWESYSAESCLAYPENLEYRNKDVKVCSKSKSWSNGFEMTSESCRFCSSCGSYYYLNGGSITDDFVKWTIYSDECSDNFESQPSTSFNLCCAPQESNDITPTCKLCQSCGGIFPEEQGTRSYTSSSSQKNISGPLCIGNVDKDYEGGYSLCCEKAKICNFCSSCPENSALASISIYEKPKIWGIFDSQSCLQESHEIMQAEKDFRVCCQSRVWYFNEPIHLPSCQLCQSCNRLTYSLSGGKIKNDVRNWVISGDECNTKAQIQSNDYELCCLPQTDNSKSSICKFCQTCGGDTPFVSGSRKKMLGQTTSMIIFGENCAGEAQSSLLGSYSLCCDSPNECNFCENCPEDATEIGSSNSIDQNLWGFYKDEKCMSENQSLMTSDNNIQVCCFKQNWPNGLKKRTNVCKFCKSCGQNYKNSGGKIKNDFMEWNINADGCQDTQYKSTEFELCCIPYSDDLKQPACKLCISCGGKYLNPSGSRRYNNGLDTQYLIYGYSCIDEIQNYQGGFQICCEHNDDINICSDCDNETQVSYSFYNNYYIWNLYPENQCLQQSHSLFESDANLNVCCKIWEWINGTRITEQAQITLSQNYQICSLSYLASIQLFLIFALNQ